MCSHEEEESKGSGNSGDRRIQRRQLTEQLRRHSREQLSGQLRGEEDNKTRIKKTGEVKEDRLQTGK